MSATSIPRAGSPWLGRWRALATPTNSRHARRALRTLSPSGPADLPRTSPSRRSLQGTCWPPARLSMTSSGSSASRPSTRATALADRRARLVAHSAGALRLPRVGSAAVARVAGPARANACGGRSRGPTTLPGATSSPQGWARSWGRAALRGAGVGGMAARPLSWCPPSRAGSVHRQSGRNSSSRGSHRHTHRRSVAFDDARPEAGRGAYGGHALSLLG